MSGFKEPNYTQTPNELFDRCMAEMGEAELRVTLAVIRKTMGYHKDRDAISWSQIMEMTGLSRSSTQDGITKATEHGYIEIAGKGKRGVNIFRLVVQPDQSTKDTSTGSVGLPVNGKTGSASRPTKEMGTKEKGKQKAPERTHPLFTIKYPSNVHSYTIKHIEAYQGEHTQEMVALVKAWAGDMFASVTEFGKSEGQMYVEVHQELTRLKVPPTDYVELATYAKTKNKWKSDKGDKVWVKCMLDYVTEYKPNTPPAATSTTNAKWAHDYEEMFGAKR